MSATEGFFILDSENSVVRDKPKVEKTAKGSFRNAARKRLGDISNLPQRPKPSTQDEKEQFVSNTTKAFIEQLQNENTELMKHLADRNKIIELSGIELQKLRINLQKMQQQNSQLAQANSQMLVELNSGKDRLKALQHELGCKNGLLKVKKLQLEEKAKMKACQETDNQVGTSKSEEARESTEAERSDNKNCTTNRKQQPTSLGRSTVKQAQLKEKTENKRVSLRRQSARLKPVKPEPSGDSFEIDDAKSPGGCLQDDQMQEDLSTSMCLSAKKDDKGGSSGPSDGEAQELRGSSMGRPSRLAAKKVQSYKEIPINVKMRRGD
ncbi:Shugoshin-1 like [Actinidia chinensis var. chinensis]|uniref:Shugoshin-1 like n=1 Tax=Actinidia chinensis var. chinensis TaxID=1590841 RepID=A0A2R6QAX5_ACTCC|nr:Shugoshin-1 like [Actinidia chinensis var. chinensis]